MGGLEGDVYSMSQNIVGATHYITSRTTLQVHQSALC